MRLTIPLCCSSAVDVPKKTSLTLVYYVALELEPAESIGCVFSLVVYASVLLRPSLVAREEMTSTVRQGFVTLRPILK